MDGLVTTEAINQEILAAERALEKNEQRFLQHENGEDTTSTAAADEPIMTRLHRLECQAEDLSLVQDYVKEVLNNNRKEEDDDMQRIHSLADLLCRYNAASNNSSSSLYRQLYEREFLPLYEYLNSHLILTLRKKLKDSNYPTDCEELLRQAEEAENSANSSRGGTPPSPSSFSSIASDCDSLQRLALIQKRVITHVEGTTVATTIDQALLELCRPFVQRVNYHFVEASSSSSSSREGHSMTSSRIDRLPEWLLNYLREHVFQSGGAWEFVYYGLSPSLPNLALDFLNEVVRMIQFALGERDFFRHPQVAGPASKPLLLCNAVEQLLQFDDFLRSLVPPNQKNRIISLVDVCIAGDEELLSWWVARERESIFSMLFEDDAPTLGRVSPRAELFCSLIRSVQAKAAVFSFTGPYLSQVAAPLCVQFLDAIHERAADLRKQLTQRKLPTDKELASNVNTWVELINGARMAAVMLTAEEEETQTKAPSSDSADADLARFGRSLERLQGVMLDEFVTDVVEVLLMERAKFAGYLMRCSHLLSSGEEVQEMLDLADISSELEETRRLLDVILKACNRGTEPKGNEEEEQHSLDPSQYAPIAMHDRLLSLIAEKLLEVALDLQGMTPDLLQPGCALFARDVDALFGFEVLPKHALRVLDITKFMSMASSQLSGLGGALCGLSGRPAPLTEDIFESDDRLYQEAMSMVRAKGLLYLELADVFAVLNRRRDLM